MTLQDVKMDLPGERQVRGRAAAGGVGGNDVRGRDPVRRDTTSTGGTVYDRQVDFMAKVGEIARKPSGEITKEDAAEVKEIEARALGGELPGPASASSYVQDVADRNERQKEAG